MANPIAMPDLSMFLKEYLEDAGEGFTVSSQAALALERDPTQLERVNPIFRAIHNLKSSSAMVGFAGIAELAHLVEDFLDRLRSRELGVNTHSVDLLFDALDLLKSLVQESAAALGRKEPLPEVAGHLDTMRRRLGQLETQALLIHQAVIAIDENGLIESFSTAAERIFGWKAEEALGKNVKMLMPEPFAAEHDQYLDNFKKTGRAKIIGIGREVTGKRKDGAVIPVDLAVNELRLGERRLFIGIIRELSDRGAREAADVQVEVSQTIRIQAGVLDSLFNLVGELIITRNQIVTNLANAPSKELRAPLATLDRLVNDMQERITAARLVSVDEVFQKFPRLARDLARARQQDVELSLEGRTIELDKAILDGIAEPLVHLLRNAVDHGLETSAERVQRGKPHKGVIRVTAAQAENHILVSVADDGRGLEPARIRAAAIKKGIVSALEAEALGTAEVIELLFRPGFSTAEVVTGVSGRGVGLDVVKTAVEKLGGRVEVASTPGQGATFTLRLPLATSIMQTLMVAVGTQIYAIPSDLISETLEVKPSDLKGIGKNQLLVVRNEPIPFIRLHDALGIAAETAAPADNGRTDLIAVIASVGARRVGLGVDAVLDQMENIIKPFDPVARKMKGFAGGTIMGDGRVALLLDVAALVGLEGARAQKGKGT